MRFRGIQGEPLTTIEVDGEPDANLHAMLRDTLSELGVQIQHIRMFLERDRMKHTLWILNEDESAIVGERRNEVQAAVLERMSAHVGSLAGQPHAEAV